MNPGTVSRTVFFLALAAPWLSAQDNVANLGSNTVQVRDKLLSFGDTDTWKLRLQPDETVWVRVAASQFDPVLKLRDADGVLLAQHDGEGTRSEFMVRVAGGGEVAVLVHGFEQKGGGQYRLELERWCSKRLKPGAIADDVLDADGRAHFRCELSRGDVIVAYAHGANVAGAVDVSARQLLPMHQGVLTVPRDGEYHVRIAGVREQTFRLRLALAERRQVPGEAILEHQVAPRGLVIWSFELPAGALRLLELEHGPHDLAWTIQPAADNTTARREQHVDVPSKNGMRRHSFVSGTGGRFEMWLHSRQDTAAPYRVRCCDPAREMGDGETPVTLPRGGVVVGKLTAGVGELLDLGARSEALDTTLALLRADGTVAAANDDIAPLASDSRVFHLVRRAGTFYAVLRCQGDGGGGAARFELARPEIARLEPGRPLRCQVPSSGYAFVHLDAEAGSELVLTTRGSISSSALTLFDPDGRQLAHDARSGVSGHGLLAVRLQRGGRHALQLVVPGGGTCEVLAMPLGGASQ